MLGRNEGCDNDGLFSSRRPRRIHCPCHLPGGELCGWARGHLVRQLENSSIRIIQVSQLKLLYTMAPRVSKLIHSSPPFASQNVHESQTFSMCSYFWCFLHIDNYCSNTEISPHLSICAPKHYTRVEPIFVWKLHSWVDLFVIRGVRDSTYHFTLRTFRQISNSA